ncbi:SAG-related sequence [Besnoitia besnoiti]|uniref:SAG-related sequence n=1 Tax=Besnoitia besnoiti TaxID=94643 RepID=A0A2A9M740_BESBE|nr:SAG-related sequence [Besnoitia besnoiti]PFH31457.1 SAG-related sequence [Besnoitia besnoiti]
MTQENNTLTVKCGMEGSFQPAGHAEFCSPKSADLNRCTGKFEEILPKFGKSWWEKGPDLISVLTVLPAAFPAEEKQFLVGCVQQELSKGDLAKRGHREGEGEGVAAEGKKEFENGRDVEGTDDKKKSADSVSRRGAAGCS